MTNEDAIKILDNLAVKKRVLTDDEVKLCDAIYTAINALEEEQWFKYSEKKPEYDGKYLITTDKGGVKISHYYKTDNYIGFTQCDEIHVRSWRKFPKHYNKNVTCGPEER